MTIQLKPGDYTKRMNLSEEQAKAVSDAFVAAGAEYGLGYPHKDNPLEHIGWDPTTGRTNMWTGMWNKSRCVRELTLDQILGTTEPVWNGEGLPPVGAEIEVRSNDNDWFPARVVGHDDGRVVYRELNTLSTLYGWSIGGGFRPLRTEEDKAVEEMLNICRDKMMVSSRQAMADLYRAGYRKTGDAK